MLYEEDDELEYFDENESKLKHKDKTPEISSYKNSTIDKKPNKLFSNDEIIELERESEPQIKQQSLHDSAEENQENSKNKQLYNIDTAELEDLDDINKLL